MVARSEATENINFNRINMYRRTNPAVIKSILLRLTKNELLEEIQIIESTIDELEPGNRRTMFLNLHVFALSHYPNAKQSSRNL